MAYQYFIIHKPYGMLCQFTKEGEHTTLADLNYSFQKDVYPVGRLDADSEGLLILTNDKSLNHALLNPMFKHQRTYCVQVDGLFTEEAKIKLEKGVIITVDGKPYSTLPCEVAILTRDNPDAVFPPRNPPIRFRKNIPTSWIELNLQEGKNRQVRKMTAAAGSPTLRLIRTKIEAIHLGNLKSGEVMELEKEEAYKKLKL
jgi:23S rRNA pseudouridine2457 synthase